MKALSLPVCHWRGDPQSPTANSTSAAIKSPVLVVQTAAVREGGGPGLRTPCFHYQFCLMTVGTDKVKSDAMEGIPVPGKQINEVEGWPSVLVSLPEVSNLVLVHQMTWLWQMWGVPHCKCGLKPSSSQYSNYKACVCILSCAVTPVAACGVKLKHRPVQICKGTQNRWLPQSTLPFLESKPVGGEELSFCTVCP